MKALWLPLLTFLCSAMLAAEEAKPSAVVDEAVVIVRIGPFSAKGGQDGVGPDQYVDLLACEITSPSDLSSYGAALALVPSPANARFKKEEGRFAKLLLREDQLKERLRAGLFIYVPTSLPTSASPASLREATPASMKRPQTKKENSFRSEVRPNGSADDGK